MSVSGGRCVKRWNYAVEVECSHMTQWQESAVCLWPEFPSFSLLPTRPFMVFTDSFLFLGFVRRSLHARQWWILDHWWNIKTFFLLAIGTDEDKVMEMIGSHVRFAGGKKSYGKFGESTWQLRRRAISNDWNRRLRRFLKGGDGCIGCFVYSNVWWKLSTRGLEQCEWIIYYTEHNHPCRTLHPENHYPMLYSCFFLIHRCEYLVYIYLVPGVFCWGRLPEW